MRDVTLGSTGITVPQNGFGALPLQRIGEDEAVALVRAAFSGGMRYFDTARAYSNSEHRVGLALEGVRERAFVATKTMARTPEAFWADLEKSLAELRTDCIDVHQFHCVDQAYAPGDGTGMYECMQEAKAQGKVRHIGVTAHKMEVAFDCVRSGLYEVLQFPLSYLSGPREARARRGVPPGERGLRGHEGPRGRPHRRQPRGHGVHVPVRQRAAHLGRPARETSLPNGCRTWAARPRWTRGCARSSSASASELAGDFCRGCGYCMPCPQGIVINQCARMALMLRRAPSDARGSPSGGGGPWRTRRRCTECRACTARCPYDLDVPSLLRKNREDYERVLAAGGA